MSDPSIYISNGTCYIAPGVEASSAFIPCGNDFYGHVSCCQKGDNCLGSNACYNIEYKVTYLSGCSDPDYKDESCPDKGAFEDSPWTGLVYCNGTSFEWTQCDQDAHETTITSPDPCWCPSTSRTVAFTDNSILENVASLPTATGETIAWASGHFPTAPTSTSASSTSSTSTSASSSLTISSIPTETSASPSATSTGDSSSSGLSAGAKAGIGVGIAAGCLILLGVLAFLFFQRRRRQRRDAEAAAAAELDHGEPKLDQHDSGTSGIPPSAGTPRTPVTPAVSELEPRAARPWSMRSELATSDTPISLSEQMELESKRGSAVSAMTPDSTPGRQHYARPDMLTPVAELPG